MTEAATVPPAIEVENLFAGYGDRMILKGLNLIVRQGEVMVIMGGSGSGKSTLLRHLIGLARPKSGAIRLLGHDITTMTEAELFDVRKRIGVAFQGGALFNSMSVGDNVMLPLRELTDLDERTMRIMARLKLEVVNLAGFDRLMPGELSGGMIKRAALARAIVMDPRLLFCDEPSAGLDPIVASALDDLILKLRDALRMTIVVVTHELDSAFKIADRIALLDKGDMVFVGPPDELRAKDDVRIQNFLNRRAEEVTIDADEYLARLTSEG
ncbi:MAG: ABC transporter ATP-binding protein [Rhodospirillaceae bacterium]|nr:ABC transporter ATP-binding protein [Rhodospirillaceae bacterium]|tara:strand:- start:1580 stop:2386 length:807 start_codon:yes stop_codon:yes gene_type:complete